MDLMAVELDDIDRKILNFMQGDLPFVEQPFAYVADALALNEEQVLDHIIQLDKQGVISRIGPMFNAAEMGGGLVLAALQVPHDSFEKIAAIVNGFDEVAHNYEREHELNMWFVLATEEATQIETCAKRIEQATGCKVYLFPKKREFFVRLFFEL